MKPHLISAIENELTLAKTLLAKGELAASFYHLERAHVIAQPYVLPHLKAHWLMLKVEFRQRRLIAVFGQAIRMLLGMIGSAVGVVPVGNTGGTNISMFKRLPIASELQNIIDGAPSKPL